MDKMNMWRAKSAVDSILSKIESINFGDGIPGSIVVYGETAAPVLTSTKHGQVVIAAAQYGKGKVVVLGHDLFILEFKKGSKKYMELFENIKAWVSNRECDKTPLFIDDVKTIDEIYDCQVVMAKTCEDKSQQFLDDLSELIYNKGLGLICGVTPWGWQQLNSNKPIEEMQISGLLAKVGVCFTEEFVNTVNGYLYTQDNKPETGNLGEILRNPPQDISKALGTICYVSHLTPGVYETLKPHVKAFMELYPVGSVYPSEKDPLSFEKNQLEFTMQDLFYNQRDLAEGIKAPGIDNFPGDFDVTPPLIQLPIELIFKSKFEEWHSTGYYLPAGKVIYISVNQGEPDDWMIQIGCHSDDLSRLDSLKRWPRIVTSKQLQTHLSFVSPYGGLVYFRNTKAPSLLSVCIHNVIPAPYFDLTNPSRGLDAWRVQRYAPGLWAEIAGRNIIITLPAAAVGEIDDPTEVIQMWDKVVQLHHELRSTDATSQRRERFVTDVQIAAGYMHSGYPIMMHMDVSDSGKFYIFVESSGS
ncbi:unnamed protein product [Owenia fusiformis]|uniref:Peptidase M60 domain-containing protein n=1 Tax=Owenia fusiformis TaxID=6347 RepID=A0A8S4NXH2_OWEFU|nr:unnamed protein product [Owenia fusiformis]